MMYNSLLLQSGGGISSGISSSPRYDGSAALVIGIGGTGMRAIAELKKRVRRQIEPDDPDSGVRRYEHIQFLAIDSDGTDIANMRGEGALDASDEFFSINMPTLAATLDDKTLIRNNPLYAWMNIDGITKLISPDGAGGVRQVGRYLLFEKVGELRSRIIQKLRSALRGQSPANIDVYVFAGISGGTGSGCFLDTCYIVRDAVSSEGVNAKVMGLFFLPDVVVSKLKPGSPAAKYNMSNGYAAMKELDYLMGLRESGDFFSQDYGSFRIDTQEPPVDMCHLFSAKNAAGETPADAFARSLNAAADYVVSYLADVQLDGMEGAQAPVTMRGNEANIAQAVNRLDRQYGANLYYHVVGAAEARVPISQIMTYLACRLFERFDGAMGRGVRMPTKDEVLKFAQSLGMDTAAAFYDQMIDGSDEFFLPDMSDKDGLDVLKDYGILDVRILPECWAKPGNDWINGCRGKFAGNSKALGEKLTSYDPSKVSAADGPLLARAFARLCEVARSRDYGPYYAAAMLSGASYTLRSCLADVREEADKKAGTYDVYAKDDLRAKVQANTDFVNKRVPPIKTRYANYIDSVRRYYYDTRDSEAYAAIAALAVKLEEGLQDLYTRFFRRLTDTLDALRATFRNDLTYLLSDQAVEQKGCAMHILELRDVQKTLDEEVAALVPDQFADDFVRAFLEDPEAWLGDDETILHGLVSRYANRVFSQSANRSIEYYLDVKYPNNGTADLVGKVQAGLLQPVYEAATPMFWNDPKFNLENPDDRCPICCVSVPGDSAVLRQAVKNMASYGNCDAKGIMAGDRISVIRLYIGVPFCVYQGMTDMKQAYDKFTQTAAGAGMHLFGCVP